MFQCLADGVEACIQPDIARMISLGSWNAWRRSKRQSIGEPPEGRRWQSSIRYNRAPPPRGIVRAVFHPTPTGVEVMSLINDYEIKEFGPRSNVMVGQERS